MTMNRRRFIGGLGLGAVALATPSALAAPAAFASARTDTMPTLLARARAALQTHGGRVPFRDRVGLVDFSAPSGLPRWQIVDLGNGRVLSNLLVAHGRGSDPANTGLLQRFSNQPGSNASSGGSFLIGDTYFGKHGRSRRLHGLEPQNDQALARAIVIHSADYVSEGRAQSAGRVGRSQGCFAVAHDDLGEVLALLGPGRLLLAAK